MTQRNAAGADFVRRVNVGDLLTRSAARAPGQEAVIDGHRRYSYASFEAWCNQLANGLLARGYVPGDALALMSGNSAEFLATYFACAKIGVVCVPINLFWRNGELAYVLGHAGVRGAVVTAELVEQFITGLKPEQVLRDVFVIGDSAAPQALPEGLVRISYTELFVGQPSVVPMVDVPDRAPLSYLYTSGTTSAPKGVVGNHLAIYLESLGTAIDTGLSWRDRALAMMPMFHTAQLNAICTPVIAAGGTILVMKSFEAERLLDLIEQEKLTVLFGLPMMYRAMVEAQRARARSVGSLRLAVYAMAPMPDHELRAAIDTFGCGFSLMFGQTEMSPVATFFRPEHQLSHPGAVGTPATNVQVGIMDEAGQLLPQGEAGEIVYRSPQALSGYLRDQDATDTVFRHGWFHSGDAGYFDADGVLWFRDRFKDVIKSGGENIASIEVEKALYACDPDIAEVVVVGLPHERWTEAVTAVVLPRPGKSIDEAALMERLREHLSPFKCPKSFIMVDAMPKTATGKIQKAVLRRTYANHYASEAPSSS
ncbi:Acyl-CoA synthetase (AMP-forming)/AMP-acid ligase II [Variovorax sp. HW608]|uniref:AMP-binding protein n=1 Tax=Variovorax sp. HW608 TaxID=1034889 RepID=UPI00081FEBEB|nr:AMP-binding protein [Variovorax sp. HW608]SCK10022.1 Acyl-CoA synthetase (AMP-forming)/AMP-acid ligase II [Variovorax sp. HW608]